MEVFKVEPFRQSLTNGCWLPLRHAITSLRDWPSLSGTWDCAQSGSPRQP